MFRSVLADEIAGLIGEEATMKLCEAWPGVALYVAYKPSFAIVNVIGQEAAVLLSSEFGGMAITPPRLISARVARKHSALRADRAQGLSASQLARKYNYGIRQVWNVLSGQDEESPNLSFNF